MAFLSSDQAFLNMNEDVRINSSDMLDFQFLFSLDKVGNDNNTSNHTLLVHPKTSLGRERTVMRLIVQNLDIFLVPLIIVLGLIGNTLSFVVFVLTRLRVLSSSIYLAALAVSDSGFLVCVFVGWMVNVNFKFYEYQGLCQMYIYLTYTFGFLSVCYVVGFTVERYIVVCFPFRRNEMCTTRRAKIVVSVMAVFALAIFSPILCLSIVDTVEGVTLCHTKPGYEMMIQVVNHIDTVITLIAPSLAIVVINTRITYLVITLQSQQKRELTVALSNSSSSSGQRRSSTYSRRASGVQVTRLLLVVSTMFVVLNLPTHAMRLHMIIAKNIDPGFEPSVNYQQWINLFQYIYYINFSINFVLYSVCGRNFRKAMRDLFKRIRRRPSKYALRQLN